jgi:hypothetical protein
LLLTGIYIPSGAVSSSWMEIMTDVCGDFETGLAEFNGYGHHVRLLVNFPPRRRCPVS